MQTHPPPPLPSTPMTVLAINLALVNDVTPARHGFVTNAVSAICKALALLNGLTAKCTMRPLGLKWPRILTQCANLHNLLSLMQHLLWLLVVLICHHATIVTLTPPIMLMIVTDPQNAANHAVVLQVLIVMIMIDVVINPLVLVLITITLLTTICQAACLTALHTYPDTNPNHPFHFDGHGKCENPITTTYCIAP